MCGLLIVGSTALALDDPSITYTARTWQMQDGLPEQTVQAFAQTRDRYLWIGTTGGLLRFDGAHFILYDRDNTPAFSENNIFNLTVAQDGTLWIATEGGGLIRYKEGSFVSYTAKDGLLNDFVRTVYQDSKGVVWIGNDTGLFRFVNGRIERVDNGGSVPYLAVHSIFEDNRGRLWAGGSRLLCLDGDSAREYHLQGEGSQNRVKSIIQTRDGTLWVGTIGGLHKMRPTSDSFKKVNETNGTVRFLHETTDGTLWIGTIGHGIYKYNDGAFTQLTAPGSLPSNTALNLFEDAENNIWIGTQAGMVRLSRTPIQTVALPDSSDYDAETVSQDHNGDLWVAAANLFRFHEGAVTRVNFPGIAGVRVRNVFRDREGALWIGTEGRGVFRENGPALTHYMTKDGLVNNFIRVFLQGRDGSVWIATDEGVSRWSHGKFTNYQMPDGLCYFSTRSLAEDHNGDIWVGTDRGVTRIHDGRPVTDAVTEALKSEKIWAIHEDSDGGLWFGTRNGGLYLWRAGNMVHYTTAQGLASNSIYEVLSDQAGTFWLSGPNGISAIDRKELDLTANDPSHPLTLRLYGISDGLETTQLYGAEKPGGVVTAKGDVLFASNKGLVRVPPERGHPSGPAPVVIDQVLADGHDIPGEKISLAPDNSKLEIHYSVIQLSSQERVRFRYKLEGFDKNWTEASSRRVAYYTNLPPGTYRFRVAAFEMNNPQQVSEAAIEMNQKPHFYRTWWFLTFCVFLLAAGIWGGHEIRIRAVHARFQAVLAERSRLAREMHDTLIQGCAGVSALLEAHSSLGDNEPLAKESLLSYARTQLRTSINEAREAVWNLRNSNGRPASIGPMLGNMAQQMTAEFGVPVEYRFSGKPFDLTQSAAHDLLMVIREALHNAIHHGQPHSIQITTDFEKNALCAYVRDDGCGFGEATPPDSSNGHYGLVGMRERVKRIGGTLIIKSASGAGTELILRIPRRTSMANNGGSLAKV
jgi:ligand-binding sensor domain-containing protein/signal transduction histidine kinase